MIYIMYNMTSNSLKVLEPNSPDRKPLSKQISRILQNGPDNGEIQKNSKFDQEIPQSQTGDKPMTS